MMDRMDDAQLRAFLQAAPDAMLLVDDAGIIREGNPAVADVFGHPPASLVGQPVSVLSPSRLRERLAALIGGEHSRRIDARDVMALHADGREIPVDISLTPVPVPGGEHWQLAAVRDVSERVRLRDYAEASAAQLRGFLDSAPDAMVVVDAHGVVQYINPQVTEMLGYSEEEVVGRSVDLLVPDRALGHHGALRRRYAANPVRRPMGARDLTARCKDGREIPVAISLGPIAQPDGADWTLAAIRDVTETRAVERELEQAREQYRLLAEHDALTGLANRRQLERELSHHVASCRSGGARGALLTMDIDRFKSVNDRFGHPVGDELIIRVGEHLRQAVRAGDLVARQGGDEFSILLREGGLEEARRVAARVVEEIREAGAFLQAHGLKVTGSVGVIAFERLSGSALSCETAMIRADKALYAAKEAGRDGVVFFEDRSSASSGDRP